MKSVGLLALVFGAILLCASPAFALTGTVVLPFAASYTAPDGASCTHRGADVAVEGDGAVTAPVEGTVTFSGRIPGSHGGSVLAVTIETGDTKVTLLPLADIAVAMGDHVAAGDELGRCAASGDPSSAGAHVHLSERRGDVYVDPAALIAAPPATQTPSESPRAEEGAEAPQPGVASASGAAAPAPVSGATAAQSPATGTTALGASASHADVASAATSSQGTSVVRGVSSGAQGVAGTASSAEPAIGEISPGVTLAPISETGAARGEGHHLAPASSPVASAARATASAARPVIAFATGHLPLAAAVLAAVVLGATGLITRRALTRRFVGERRVSDRFGIVLQHLRTGDTLCRLTSCPGPLPSQSRGH